MNGGGPVRFADRYRVDNPSGFYILENHLSNHDEGYYYFVSFDDTDVCSGIKFHCVASTYILSLITQRQRVKKFWSLYSRSHVFAMY